MDIQLSRLTVNISRTSPTEEYIRISDLLIDGMPRPKAMSLLESLIRATIRRVRHSPYANRTVNDLADHHSVRRRQYSQINLCTSIASGRPCASF
jgi:hypothetical protein